MCGLTQKASLADELTVKLRDVDLQYISESCLWISESCLQYISESCLWIRDLIFACVY